MTNLKPSITLNNVINKYSSKLKSTQYGKETSGA